MPKLDPELPLANFRQEQFCQAYVQYGTQSRAVKEAGFKSKEYGCRLFKRPEIVARIDWLTGERDGLERPWTPEEQERILAEIGRDKNAAPLARIAAIKLSIECRLRTEQDDNASVKPLAETIDDMFRQTGGPRAIPSLTLSKSKGAEVIEASASRIDYATGD